MSIIGGTGGNLINVSHLGIRGITYAAEIVMIDPIFPKPLNPLR